MNCSSLPRVKLDLINTRVRIQHIYHDVQRDTKVTPHHSSRAIGRPNNSPLQCFIPRGPVPPEPQHHCHHSAAKKRKQSAPRQQQQQHQQQRESPLVIPRASFVHPSSAAARQRWRRVFFAPCPRTASLLFSLARIINYRRAARARNANNWARARGFARRSVNFERARCV